MKQFDIPEFYRSPIIGKVKSIRKSADMRKRDFSPTVLDFGSVRFLIPRHFGFCYGVENAIEIAYKAVNENPNKRIFLLSQMIHNPEVNADLLDRGIKFIMDTAGKQLIPWDDIDSNDIVLIPAFGTTIEIENLLKDKGIEIQQYNTTCPFVEKVWKRSSKLGTDNYTVIIHGKPSHEETRATFSHSNDAAPSLVIKNMSEAIVLADFIKGIKPIEQFAAFFPDRYSSNFDPAQHLSKLGVVNQTTMLAEETQAIAEFLKGTIIGIHGEDHYKTHFADTRDTLCYATNDNQTATKGLLDTEAHMAVVIGGYNSSNTSHLVELLEDKFPTYFINSDICLKSEHKIVHFNMHREEELSSDNYLDGVSEIILTSGASCPDASVDRVLQKLLTFFPGHIEPTEAIDKLEKQFIKA